MHIKLLSEIVGNVVGKQGAEIVNILEGKKNVNEFLIAKKLKLTINQTRNILYKLSDAGLVSFTRKKDKRKGWYTYFWTLNSEKSLELLETNVKHEIENFKNQIKNRETRRYYVCKTCKTEVSEETALLHNFICSECGEVYSLQEDKKIISDLVLKINKLINSLTSIQQELFTIREKRSKKKAKEEKNLKNNKKKTGKKIRKKSRKKLRKKKKKHKKKKKKL
jgi:transcription initiation factor TFIIE subunit alpha